MSAGSVLPIFLAIAVIFVPLGITLVMASNSVSSSSHKIKCEILLKL